MSNGRIAGKIALITGGARGQGRQEAERFAAEGATVYITDVLDDVGAAAADELGDAVTFLHHDVTSEDDWAAVIAGIVEQHGRIDILVNNAGIFSMTAALDTSIEAWNQMVAINQTGVFLGIRDVGRVMCEQGSGSIINISSIAGLAGVGRAHAYAATKWAVRGMSKSAAIEFAAHGVRVNSVHPGIIDTDMLREFGGNLERITESIPMGRTASADEVANVVLFLASEEASYCSGHEFVVDGAMNA
ncbi:MAG: glucose 1-dehydrogenase [Ilumatobacter sp.]|uniref:glucose 1-dehydrogenase n=1 Tax=Ilumatobacter sp. TaxID=1967498 RepID=UPI002A34D5D6|nr:glucose 1-dehydrogenase [Ilumatobacter sp.]MDG1391976.1 glucose 1-dehydrogenase [Ilumatobacter sp.]MDG1785722.1 glucose 1-dehydrogenase [Ilumatobacter sp.]MDG2233710.1 glucose 1-dehydrogenase [Ilumatobacter sp.]